MKVISKIWKKKEIDLWLNNQFVCKCIVIQCAPVGYVLNDNYV